MRPTPSALAITLALLLVITWIVVRNQDNTPALQTQTQAQTASAGSQARSQQAIQAPVAPTTVAPSKDNVRPKLSLTLPASSSVRKEIENNPHDTPESLKQFARELAPQMESALISGSTGRARANRLAPQLARCALAQGEPQTPHSLRALCLTNLDRLAEKHGGNLKSAAKQVRSRVPARVSLLAISI